PGLEIVIDSPQDALPRVINLDGFTPSVQEAERITNGWDQFTTRCKQRTEAYQRSNPSPYHHYFYEDIDTVLLAGTIDAQLHWLHLAFVRNMINVVFPTLFFFVSTYSLTKLLRSFPGPTLIVNGQNDKQNRKREA